MSSPTKFKLEKIKELFIQSRHFITKYFIWFILFELSTLEKYDSQKMYATYDKWPIIARESWESIIEPIPLEGIDHIVFVGMGGSGAMGDLFEAIFSSTNIHVTIVKGYLLPKTVDQNTLVICTSISGDTIETISILEKIKKMDCRKIAMSSGGKIEKICNNSSVKYFKVPLFHSPRSSFTAFLYSLLRILETILPLTKTEVEDSINELETLQIKINSNKLDKSNPAIEIAIEVKGIPMILYPNGFQAAAIRFKNSLQENAKTHVFTEDIIEFCHNGIVSWEKKSEIIPILIEGKDDHIKTKERWKIIKKFFQENNINFKEISSIEGNILSKLVNLIYLLDYSTIYRAVMNKTDPSPVKSIDFIKKRL